MIRRALSLLAVAVGLVAFLAPASSAIAGPLPSKICETVDGHQVCIYFIPPPSSTESPSSGASSNDSGSQQPGTVTVDGSAL